MVERIQDRFIPEESTPEEQKEQKLPTPDDDVSRDIIPTGEMLINKADIEDDLNPFHRIVGVLANEGGSASLAYVAEEANVSEEELWNLKIDNVIYPIPDFNGEPIMYSPAIRAAKKFTESTPLVPVFPATNRQQLLMTGD